MNYVAILLTVVVAVLHFYFMVLEMFLWTKPIGLRVFRNTPEKAQGTAVLAANQGLYNGFLGAGLIWALTHPDPTVGQQLKVFFFSCIVVAGLYGAKSVSLRIFWIQSFPAILGMIAVFLVAK